MVDQSTNNAEAVAAECHNPACKKKSSDSLSFCGACKKARYCSKDCQKQNWKDHKFYCKHVATNGTSSASLDALEFYEKVAAYDPRAQALARDIGLTLPTPGRQSHGLNKPVRRLVAKGKDTPENLALFFGQGNTGKGGEIDQSHKESRIEILLRPPPGSPSYVMAKGLGLDEGCPMASWTPREPSAAEARELNEILDMQETIRRHMGVRGVEHVSSGDMRDILVQNFGNRWVDGMKVYQDAINSMDQGVQG